METETKTEFYAETKTELEWCFLVEQPRKRNYGIFCFSWLPCGSVTLNETYVLAQQPEC